MIPQEAEGDRIFICIVLGKLVYPPFTIADCVHKKKRIHKKDGVRLFGGHRLA